MMNKETYKYSVVLPVLNEEKCLEDVLKNIKESMRFTGDSYELVIVDDGSTDDTWNILEKVANDKNIKAIKLSRNFGHQKAIFAGIRNCNGQYAAIMDADGQDPPDLLPKLFSKCEEGYEVVYAVRKKRKENILKRISYKLFYRIYRSIVPFYVPLDSGDFSVISSNVINFIKSLDEKNPFIRGLRSWHGGKQIGIEYERLKRSAGKEKYSYYKLFRLAVSGTVSFSKIPLRLISLLGILISLLSFVYGTYLIFLKVTVGINLVGWTSTVVLISFFGGVNLFVLGIIGEYVGEIFDDVKNRPSYLIEKEIN